MIISKTASIVVSSVIVIVIVCSSEPLDQETNSYPSSGVAVMVTSVPSLYSPPSVSTVPPSPELTVRV